MTELKNLREIRWTSKIRVRIHGEERKVTLRIGQDGVNTFPLGEKVFLEPGGFYLTEDIELLAILPWED